MPKEKSGEPETRMYSVSIWIDNNQKKDVEMAYLNSGAKSKGEFYSNALREYCGIVNRAIKKGGK